MEQAVIGKFISDIRKERGMTQRQLANIIGVSDKTISKWECGKGMPEVTSLVSLCNALGISVNELISGERLLNEDYSKKAEVNMLNLLRENKRTKRNLFPMLLLTIIILALAVGYVVATNMDVYEYSLLFDSATLLNMLFVTGIYLLGTDLWRAFITSLGIVIKRKRTMPETELYRTKLAVDVVGKTWLIMGCINSCIGIMNILPIASGEHVITALGITIKFALNGILYGLVGFLLLLLIKIRIEVMYCDTHSEQQ